MFLMGEEFFDLCGKMYFQQNIQVFLTQFVVV